MFFLSHCCQSPFPCWESQSTHLPRMPSNTADLWTCCGGSSDSNLVLLLCVLASTAIRASVFSFGELSMAFYIFRWHRVCLVDLVDLICSLYSWSERLGSSSLVTLPLGFNCGFISTSACESSIEVCSWGCAGELGFAPGNGATCWVSGVLEAPGTQGNWWLGQQEI